MHEAIPITEDIFWVGVNDFETHLFEAIWPIPRGVSYNSYLIRDEKIALIDTVNAHYLDNFAERLKKIIPEGKGIDYLIINHMEPDHSGSIKVIKAIYPDIKIVGNKKTLNFLNNFYQIDDGLIEIQDQEVLDLGKHKLEFHLTPMVHWPETMMSFETNTKTLFSGDAFGGFGALSGGIFDDEVDIDFYENETLRYYSNIVGRFSPMVQRAMKTVSSRVDDIRIIAATHGPVFRENPKHILDQYDRWSRYESEKGVVVAYASMYGNTRSMAEAVARSLTESGIENVRLHNVSRTHLSYLLTDIWRFKGLVLGSCTYNMELFPLMNSLIDKLEPKMMQNRLTGIFGSFTWSGGALKALKKKAENDKWNIVEPDVEVQSAPLQDHFTQLSLLGKNMAEAIHKEFDGEQ